MSGQISFRLDFDQVVERRMAETGCVAVMMCLSALTEVLAVSVALITCTCYATPPEAARIPFIQGPVSFHLSNICVALLR